MADLKLPPGATLVDQGQPAGQMKLPPGATLVSPPEQGGFFEEAVRNPARQVGAGALGAAATANKLTANTFDLLDKAAEYISKATGTEKGGIFRQIADYTRQSQAQQEQKAQELSGGRGDFVSQLYRGGAQGALELPQYAIAGHLAGPVAGMAGISALSEADKGPAEAAKAAIGGALTGGAMKVMGPGSRLLRAGTLGGGTAAQAAIQGADPATALARGVTMGGMAAMHPGGKTLKEAVRDEALYRGGQAVSKIATQVGGGRLNPVEQAAIDEAKAEGVPLKFGTLTGNRAIQALEETTASSPLGAQRAAQFNRGTVEGLEGWAGRMAQRAHPEPVTPESVGRAIPAKMDKIIAAESEKRNAAYERAWVGRDDPTFDEIVPVAYRKGAPVLDAEGQETGFHEQEPVMEKVNMPVDISNLKSMAKPIYDELNFRLAPAAQNASAGFHALEVLLKSPDYVPAWQAEPALGALKSMARLETGEGVRDVSQGIAAHLVPTLQEGIDAAVAKAGDDALAGLNEGRKIHAGIMDVEDVARPLRDKEPVKNFGRLVWPKDTGIDYLREVEKLAPEHMPAVGRAKFEDMIGRVFREGDVKKTLGILNEWRDLGPETKKIFFPDAKWRGSADNLIKALDMSAKVVNTSGTEIMRQATTGGPAKWLKGYIGGRLFYTPEGIQLLTDAIKPQSPGSRALNAAKLKAAAAKEPPPPETPPEEPPPGGPGAAPSAGPGPGAPPAPPRAALPKGAPPYKQWRDKHFEQSQENGLWKDKQSGALFTDERLHDDYHQLWETITPGESTRGGSPGEPAPGAGLVALREAQQHAAETIEANKAKLAGTAAAPSTAPGGAPPQQGSLGRISGALDEQANAAIERMRKRGTFSGTQANALVPANDLADMAIWGAAKIAKGTVDFAKWSKEMIADAGPQIKPHLEKMWAKSQKLYEGHIATTGSQLPDTKRLLALAKLGVAGKEWYTKTRAELEGMFGPDADMMQKFLAATSPNNTVAGNVSQALKAYSQWRLGKPFEGYLPLHADYLNKIAAGEPFGKLKVDSFLRNLAGEAEPVTVDRWIARAFKFPTDQPTPGQYKFMDYTLTQIAKRHGMEPRQLQAMIWTAVKELDAKGKNTTSLPFEALLPKKIAADPQMQALIKRAKAGEAAATRP